VILYALLCGTLPFEDAHMPNLFNKIKSGTYSIPSHLSVSARDLITRILNVNPLKRFTINEIKQHNWFTHKLPGYLALPPAAFITQSAVVDDDVVAQVCDAIHNVTPFVVKSTITKSGERMVSRASQNSFPTRSPLGSLSNQQISKSVSAMQEYCVSQLNKQQLAISHGKTINVEVAYQLLLSQKLKQQQISDVVMARQAQEQTPPPSRDKSPCNFQTGSVAGLLENASVSLNGQMLKLNLSGAPPLPATAVASPAASSIIVQPSVDNANRRRLIVLAKVSAVK
jgi:serine/threonine protein kinase